MARPHMILAALVIVSAFSTGILATPAIPFCNNNGGMAPVMGVCEFLAGPVCLDCAGTKEPKPFTPAEVAGCTSECKNKYINYFCFVECKEKLAPQNPAQQIKGLCEAEVRAVYDACRVSQNGQVCGLARDGNFEAFASRHMLTPLSSAATCTSINSNNPGAGGGANQIRCTETVAPTATGGSNGFAVKVDGANFDTSAGTVMFDTAANAEHLIEVCFTVTQPPCPNRPGGEENFPPLFGTFDSTIGRGQRTPDMAPYGDYPLPTVRFTAFTNGEVGDEAARRWRICHTYTVHWTAIIGANNGNIFNRFSVAATVSNGFGSTATQTAVVKLQTTILTTAAYYAALNAGLAGDMTGANNRPLEGAGSNAIVLGKTACIAGPNTLIKSGVLALPRRDAADTPTKVFVDKVHCCDTTGPDVCILDGSTNGGNAAVQIRFFSSELGANNDLDVGDKFVFRHIIVTTKSDDADVNMVAVEEETRVSGLVELEDAKWTHEGRLLFADSDAGAESDTTTIRGIGESGSTLNLEVAATGASLVSGNSAHVLDGEELGFSGNLVVKIFEALQLEVEGRLVVLDRAALWLTKDPENAANTGGRVNLRMATSTLEVFTDAASGDIKPGVFVANAGRVIHDAAADPKVDVYGGLLSVSNGASAATDGIRADVNLPPDFDRTNPTMFPDNLHPMQARSPRRSARTQALQTSTEDCCGNICGENVVVRQFGVLIVGPKDTTGENPCRINFGGNPFLGSMNSLMVMNGGKIMFRNIDDTTPPLRVVDPVTAANTLLQFQTGSIIDVTLSPTAPTTAFQLKLFSFPAAAVTNIAFDPANIVINGRRHNAVSVNGGIVTLNVLAVPVATPPQRPTARNGLHTFTIESDRTPSEFNSDVFLTQVAAACDVDPEFISVISVTSANAGTHTRINFRCTDPSSEAAADERCDTLIRNAMKDSECRTALSTVSANRDDFVDEADEGSNTGLYGLFGLAAIPLLCCIAACILLKSRKRKADVQYEQDSAAFSNVASAPQPMPAKVIDPTFTGGYAVAPGYAY